MTTELFSTIMTSSVFSVKFMDGMIGAYRILNPEITSSELAGQRSHLTKTEVGDIASAAAFVTFPLGMA